MSSQEPDFGARWHLALSLRSRGCSRKQAAFDVTLEGMCRHPVQRCESTAGKP